MSAPVASSSDTRYGRPGSDTSASTRPSLTVTLESTPPDGSLVFHTTLPVSAFSANTQPRFDATKRQPSAIAGVPVKSPSPPADCDEKVHTGPSVAASSGPMSCSASWNRVLNGSCP